MSSREADSRMGRRVGTFRDAPSNFETPSGSQRGFVGSTEHWMVPMCLF
jgi:hypothetical protein